MMKRSKPFQFKKFTIEQTLAAFKVTGDSVYLGAWANLSTANFILDIGTGTSILALMAAQRNNNAEIYAIEPDLGSYQDAITNTQNCEWKNRIHVIHSSFQDYNPNFLFDHIISNPPYFTNQLNSPDIRKNAARHTDENFLNLLFEKSYHISTPNAKLSIIIPEKTYEHLDTKKWHLHRISRLNTGGKNTRFLVALEFQKEECKHLEKEELFIRKDNEYSKEYLEQTKDFYLFVP